jgi:hypothetical protein
MPIIASPAIDPLDYAWLQSRVARWLHRTDLTADIKDFITLAEARINADLDARAQDQIATLATVAHASVLPIPTDLLNVRSFLLQNIRELDYMAPENFNARYGTAGEGSPIAYTIIGGNFYFGPTPDSNYSLTLAYQGNIPSLAANGTNFLMSAHPNVYLFATLVESTKFIADDGRLPTWEISYQQAIKAVNDLDWAVSGPMRVRSDVRNK